MKVALVVLEIIFIVYLAENGQCQLINTRNVVLDRQKRWLVWKEGTNWVAVIFGIGIPVDLKDESVTLGMVLKAYYQLPNNDSYYTHPSIDYERKKRSASRWSIYGSIQEFLERNKYGNGKSCLLKSICEAAGRPLEKKSGLLAEILHTILTPSSTDDEMDNHISNEYYAAEHLGKRSEDCSALFSECRTSILEQFSRLLF